ncbi:MAG: hypothetical protein AAGG50_08135 [Bacteroidota bacterium]
MTTLSRYLALLLLPAFLVLAACDSNDPDDTDGAGEEEVISVVNLTFTPQGGGTAAVFTANFDEEGVLEDRETIILDAGTTYDVSIELLNDFEDPAEDITIEVRDEEPGAHRFFYTPEGGVANRLTVSNLDRDPLGDPLGVTFDVAVSAGGAATGAFRAKLRHYEDGADLPADKRADTPTAPEVPDVVENDFDFTFPVEIQEPLAGEPEVISTVNLTFAPQGGGAATTSTANFDENGTLQAVGIIQLTSGTVYDVSIELLDEFQTPPDDITGEIRAEAENHRFFYTPEGGVANRITISDLDTDSNGDPLGVTFQAAVSAGSAATGSFRAKLRFYEDGATLPDDKRNDTADAPEVPGVVENDLNFAFPVELQ